MGPPNNLPRRNLLLRLRPVLRWLFRLRGSPRAIAGGLAVGTFIAFTPTVGIQVIIAVVAATLFNLNRPAAIIPVWITNPVTVAPLYTFIYWVGLWFCDGPPVAEVSKVFIGVGATMARLEFWNITEQFLAVFKMGTEILLPLLVGGIVVGLAAAILVYLASMKLLALLFARRARKRLLNERKKRQR